MRILFHSNWTRGHTGYAGQTRQVTSRLRDLGHEVIVSANCGIQGGAVEIDGILHLPGALTALDSGQHALPMHVRELMPDLTITLLDVWPLPEDFGLRIRQAGSPWVPWVPVDHDPCPPRTASRLKHASGVVAMSEFGRGRLAQAGIQAVHIPHGVETSVYKPADKSTARRKIGFPQNTFLVIMVQANKGYPSRKCFQQQLEGFARFHARHTGSLLYLHSWEGSDFGGPNLSCLARALGIREAIICQDHYQAFVGIPDQAMARIFQSADVTLNATGGEGFGLPIIESLACGVPVVVTDFSSMTELCPEGVGWRVGFSGRFFTALDSFQVWPDPARIESALEAALCADREAMVRPCVEFAGRFDADRLVKKRWVPLLEEALLGFPASIGEQGAST